MMHAHAHACVRACVRAHAHKHTHTHTHRLENHLMVYEAQSGSSEKKAAAVPKLQGRLLGGSGLDR